MLCEVVMVTHYGLCDPATCLLAVTNQRLPAVASGCQRLPVVASTYTWSLATNGCQSVASGCQVARLPGCQLVASWLPAVASWLPAVARLPARAQDNMQKGSAKCSLLTACPLLRRTPRSLDQSTHHPSPTSTGTRSAYGVSYIHPECGPRRTATPHHVTVRLDLPS